MIHDIKINSTSNYNGPTLNCTVNCYLTQEDMDKDNAIPAPMNSPVVYSIPFQISLQQCYMQGLSKEQVLDLVKKTGEDLYNQQDQQNIIKATEYQAGLGITTPMVV